MQLEIYLKQNQSVLPPIIFTAFVQHVSTIFTIIRTETRWLCIFVNLLFLSFVCKFCVFQAMSRYLPRGEDSFRTLTKMCKIYLLQVSQLIWVTRRLVPKIISNVFFVFISCDYIYSDDRFCQTNMPCKGSLPGKRGFFGGLFCREFGLVNL